MRAPLSIVIPTLDAAEGLPACLAALVEGLTDGLICDLVVSDGGSGDATLAIADDAGARIVKGPSSRGGQLRRGADAARGEWLLFLHSDTVLSEGWTGPVRDALETPCAYHFRLRFDARGAAPRVVEGWANLRAGLFGLPYGDQGLLVPRRIYEAAGGFPDIPLMEDVALVRALPKVRALPVTACTSARRYERQGWLRRGARNLTTLARYLAGADPVALAQAYRR